MAYNPLLNPHPVSGTVTANAGTGTMAVSGTFWQATQPVSLASTTITGSVAVTGTFWQATQPVSGTFFQATQPVSIASMPSTPVTGTFWQATQPISIAAALPAGTNHLGTIGVYDVELGLQWGTTTLRDRLVAQRYTILADSVADGFAAFWTTTNASGGTAVVATGEGVLDTSASATGSTHMVSTAPAYYPGQVAWLNSAIRFGDTGSAGNIRRVGAVTMTGTTPQNGFAYELDGTSLYVASYKAGVVTRVLASAMTVPYTLDLNYVQLEIRWTSNRADFYINNTWRHTLSGGTTSITGTLNFPMLVQNTNTAGATSRTLMVRNIGLGRFGQPEALSSAGPLSIAKAEDVASADGDVGTPAMAVRRATPVNSSGTDGDYEMLQMSGGRLYTSASVDNVLTKGTQGATGVSTQDLKDAGRVSYCCSTVLAGVTAVITTEAMLSMVPVRDGVAAAAATTFAVTANKRWRIQKIVLSGNTTAAAVLSARISLRLQPAAAATITSPKIATASLNGAAAVALTGDHVEIILPDGFEISGTMQIGLGQLAAAITGTLHASIIGYEY